MDNQECKIRPQVVNINSDNPFFYPYSIEVNKCNGSCNNINDPYSKLCVPNAVKNTTVKVSNLVPKTTETRYIEWDETCKCKCRLTASAYNKKQRWNKHKCKCECKELIGKGGCDERFIWNTGHCECHCDKPSDVQEYLDYENCKCRKKLAGKIVEECSENIDKNDMISVTLNGYRSVCNCCTTYIALFDIAFLNHQY